MTMQQLVSPSQIENELQRIWEELAKENKMRASIFNLLVFHRLSQRTDYLREIVQKVVEKFPCRILFISEDTEAHLSYLKTAVSVVIPEGKGGSVACDQIDVGVSTPSLDRVPFLLFPHLLPDLPVYLLWAEDPSQQHPLFSPLTKLATRVIFDSETASHLLPFAKTLLSIKELSKTDIADLNWARMEGWRDLLASTFDTRERLSELLLLSSLQIGYNAAENPFFCHLNIQAVYLIAWLASRFQWKFLRAPSPQSLFFQGESGEIEVMLVPKECKGLHPGALLSLRLQTREGFHCEAIREKERDSLVKIQLSSREKCELPYHFLLGHTMGGISLAKEISNKGTSRHFLEMLKELVRFAKELPC